MTEYSSWRDITGQRLATARPRRVLLIEDDPDYVDAVRRVLLAADGRAFSLEAAPTLRQGLEALRSSRYDVIVLDLGLPDEHGTRTFDRVREEAGITPIVVTTSADDPEVAAHTLYLGAADYLVKGASDDLLLHVLGRAISRVYPYGETPDLDDDPLHRPLSDADEAQFERLLQMYLDIMDVAVERRIVRQSSTDYREAIRRFVERLVRIDASARDAVAIHTAAVEQVMRQHTPGVNEWIAESRLVAMELLMLLCDRYRTDLQLERVRDGRSDERRLGLTPTEDESP